MRSRRAYLAAAVALLAACHRGPPPDAPLLATRAPVESRAAGAEDPPEARKARQVLVDSIARREPGLSRRVLDAMRQVPRHLYMPGAPLSAAYVDSPYPIGWGQTISQPYVVALMSDALELSGRERVLEIGTGSGYQAAILGLLAAEVYTIEIVEPLGRRAAARLRALGFANVHVRVGDGYRGWPDAAPFDRILLTAAPPELPRALVAQLRDGGILVGPVGPDGGEQQLMRWTKRGSRLEAENLGPVRFVPMVPARPD